MNSSSTNSRPLWRDPGELPADSGPPAALHEWLLDMGSLTHRLREHYGERVSMTLTGQAEEPPLPEEAALLGMDAAQAALVRRVVLRVDGEPVVHGRAVIPPATLQGEGSALARLEDRPLGEVAFAELGARRRDLEIARLAAGSRVFPQLAEAAWARRSVLDAAVGPVLVTEAFLPALVAK